MVETPNWDTKIRCSCGEDFTSRCEFFKHGYEALWAESICLRAALYKIAEDAEVALQGGIHNAQIDGPAAVIGGDHG